MKSRSGFTLIELLIVVAIIAILAAIAVPNFLEAQTRSKVSRVKSDMRTIATALESYYVDSNKYPYDGTRGLAGGYNYWYLPFNLSTPISYVTSTKFQDPFREQIDQGTPGQGTGYQSGDLRYASIGTTWGTDFGGTQSTFYPAMVEEWGGWRLSSAGPDKSYGPAGWEGLSTRAPLNYPATALAIPYDATNGTVSDGVILRSQKSSNGYLNAQ